MRVLLLSPLSFHESAFFLFFSPPPTSTKRERLPHELNLLLIDFPCFLEFLPFCTWARIVFPAS